MTCLSIRSWLNNGTGYRFSACEVKLKSSLKVVVYFHDVHATTESVGMYGQVSHYCSHQGSQLGMINSYFSSPVASSTMKTSQ